MAWNLNTISLIVNNQLYFSSPCLFNDPQDTHFKISFSKPALYYQKILKRLTNSDSCKQLLIQILLNKNSKYSSEAPQFSLEELVKIYSSKFKTYYLLACFSERNDSVIMYSHYADNHKGICLEFDQDDLITDKEICEFVEVVYSKKVFTVDYFEFIKEKNHLKCYSTKHKDWAYEKEVRCLINNINFKEKRNDNTGKLVNINSSAIKSIIMGNNMKPDQKNVLKNILRGIQFQGKLFQAIIKNNDYGIDFEEMDFKL